MSTKEFLQHTILAHLHAKECAERKKTEQAEMFETHASTFYSQLESMLAGIQGIELFKNSVTCSDFTSKIETLCVKVLDKTVTFEPEEQSGERGLNVTGLFDRAMFYRPLKSGEWEANDERSGRAVRLTNEVLFTRLAAIVPG
ncbi:hypothetical protein [Pseudomonas sp. Irchel 3F6]|jgi:hypothetical protein|uniref:hypothetical protein n=1 Tax=Pseudomonas sp. Irchel 3F6 TaxID=2009003 RepID=UPI000BA36128|nr:hypothetical protein [Pseudomonas sp. Irchel 3F6]